MPTKYTENDIERIFLERVKIFVYAAIVKSGTIAEWTFTYPNGEVYANVVCSFPVDPKNDDAGIAMRVCNKKIKEQLWQLCGQYSIITGAKL